MAGRAPKYVIILAGGKGTRMRSADCHKVCFPIDGVPAINRVLKVYLASGIVHPIVVVGSMAGQVMETIGKEYEGVIYAYQAQQLGTAHATRQGARVLQALDANEEVLVVAGDRVVELQVLEQLYDLFYGKECDLAFLMGSRGLRSDPGLILFHPDGSVMGNVEAIDIRQRHVYHDIRSWALENQLPDRDALIARVRQDFSESKAAVALGELWKILTQESHPLSAKDILQLVPESLTRFDFTDQNGKTLSLSHDQVNQAEMANFSVYLIRIRALQVALSQLSRENAQAEEYLSDLITVVSQAREDGHPRFRVRALRVDNPNYVMAFNNPAELLEIEEYIQTKKRRALTPDLPAGDTLQRIDEWQAAFQASPDYKKGTGAPLSRHLATLYGPDAECIRERSAAFMELLSAAGERWGGGDRVLLVRSPGRVNLMGRHVDHQGGNCNLMTIGFETVMVVHPREDDRVMLYNLDAERFPDRQFSIGDMLAELPWDDWLSLVNSRQVTQQVMSAVGDWSQYVKAAVLRLQKKFSSVRLRGADLLVSGNIPIAAGLSSSSALVVATAEAMVTTNQLNTFPAQFVDLCGEGEWFVGTRGGSADHAAIKLGRQGEVVKVGFFPFTVMENVPFPEDAVLAVCDSGVKAPKTTTARDQFNHRVSCYHLGLCLIKKLFPHYAPLLAHLRDVNVRTLGVPLTSIYKILLRLPERATRAEIERLVPETDLQPLFSTHNPPADGLYPIRGVVLFGLAECERSRIFTDLLRDKKVKEIGRLMCVSHDGDRVCRTEENGEQSPFRAPISNGYLLDLIEDLESGDPDRVIRAQLEWQPGSYHCSVSEIDRMVDISLATPGVYGAQLAGAGLGGCMMVLAQKQSIPALVNNLDRDYYQPAGKKPSILICRPIAGSSVLLNES